MWVDIRPGRRTDLDKSLRKPKSLWALRITEFGKKGEIETLGTHKPSFTLCTQRLNKCE